MGLELDEERLKVMLDELEKAFPDNDTAQMLLLFQRALYQLMTYIGKTQEMGVTPIALKMIGTTDEEFMNASAILGAFLLMKADEANTVKDVINRAGELVGLYNIETAMKEKTSEPEQ